MYHQQKSHGEIGVINASVLNAGLDSLVRRATSCRRLPEDLRSASTLSPLPAPSGRGGGRFVEAPAVVDICHGPNLRVGSGMPLN